MKSFICAFVCCVLIASTCAGKVVKREVLHEKNTLRDHLIETAKTETYAARKLKLFECMREGTNMSIKEIYNDLAPIYSFPDARSMPDLVKYLCENVHDSFECYRASELEGSNEKLQDPKTEKIIEFYSVLENMMNYVCSINGGEMITQTYVNVQSCDFKDGSIQECFGDLKPIEISPHPDKAQCGQLHQIRECFTQLYKDSCKSPLISEIFVTMSTEFLSQLKCSLV